MDLILLRDYINQNINTKYGDDKITGSLMNVVLLQMVDSLLEIGGTGFGGDLSPSDNPGVPVAPIYFMASAVGEYTYCGGVSVTTTPAFVVWNGTEWKAKNIGLPAVVSGNANKCQGLAFAGDVAPTGKEVNDWYVFMGGGTLNWPGASKTSAGIVYLKMITTENNVTTYYWDIVAFGQGDGTSDPIEVDAVPTQNSTNPVASGGAFDALANKVDKTSLVREDRMSLLGHTTVPTSFWQAENITAIPVKTNIDTLKLVNTATLAELPLITTGGVLAALPVAVPAANYNYVLTYTAGLESGVLIIQSVKQ